jgi:membrane protease YdiL (CAAX protease family)
MRGGGEDLAGGFFRRLYHPVNPAGLAYALGVVVALVVLNQLLQGVFSAGLLMLTGGDLSDTRSLVKAGLVSVLPASLIIVLAGWWLAGRGGADPRAVLSLRVPRLSAAGWLFVIGGFVVVMYVAITLLVLVLGIDVAQYTPGPDGQSPPTGSAGLVKEAMFDIANEPLLFMVVFLSVAVGAPLAEEVTFRGQLFSALSQTRLGVTGTTVVTAGLWAMLHVTEPWLSIAIIFMMGLVFGWLMYRFGSLWVAIACHGVWNGAYALLIFFTQGATQ